MSDVEQPRIGAPLRLHGCEALERRHAGQRHLPDALNPALLALRHGPIFGRIQLWLNRARMRHQLGRLAEEASDALLSDMGLSRALVAREAARWFWEDMEFRECVGHEARQPHGRSVAPR